MPEQKTTVELHRLTRESYLALSSKVPGPQDPKTDLQAGYLLGIQFVLQKLREGWVIGE